MNYYYIDFENVKTAGLKGIETLPSGDTVKIFAKGGSDQMKFNDIKTLMACKATVAIEDVVTGTKNALDFQLLTDLMVDCMKRAGMSTPPRFVIISADHGYDPAITQMKKRGINNVFRAVTIKDAENGEDASKSAEPKAQKNTRRRPARKPAQKGAAKGEQKPAQKGEAKAEAETVKKPAAKPDAKPAAGQEKAPERKKPSVRRVHTRTINKSTDSQKN